MGAGTSRAGGMNAGTSSADTMGVTSGFRPRVASMLPLIPQLYLPAGHGFTIPIAVSSAIASSRRRSLHACQQF